MSKTTSKVKPDERYPIMKLEMGSGISRTSIYTLEIKLDSWDKKTKEKFMNGDIFKDSELRHYAKKVLKKHGLKDAHISSGWGCEIQSSESEPEAS